MNSDVRKAELPADPDVTEKINSDGTTSLPRSGGSITRANMSQVTMVPPPISARDTEPVCSAPLDETYRKGNCFAGGGQAEIFKGEDINLRRQVAIKSLREELVNRPDARAAFINEARITAQLDHPGIVPIYSINTDSRNGLHLVMKIIRGTSLRTRLGTYCQDYKQNRIPPGAESNHLSGRLEIALKICEALEYAHSRNVMHCDLKPENVMLGESGEVYLMDWGLARLIREPGFDPKKWEAPQQIAGTPRYLSPEAANGLYCDQRADIYSLGLILYELIFLAPAFEGKDYAQLLKQIRGGQMRPLHHRFKRHVSPDLKAVVRKAIAPRREERYASVADLAADLRRHLRGEAVSARPESWFESCSRWCAQRREVMLAMVLTGLLLGVIGISNTLYHRIYHERERNQRLLAVSEALADCTLSGYRLDRALTRYEFSLSTAASEAMFLLNSPDLVGRRRAFAQTVPGIELPKDRHGDPARIAWNVAPGANVAHLNERLIQMALLRPRLLSTLLERAENRIVSGADSGNRLAEAAVGETPVSRIYFGFDDGLFINYPAAAIRPDYDPRNRIWYRGALRNRKSAKPTWFHPYRSVEGYAVLSCAIPMVDAAGRFHGVAALDLRLSNLTAALWQNGNLGSAVLEKFLLDSEGNIITFGGKQNRKEEETPTEGLFPDETLRNTFLNRRNGFVIRQEGKRKIVYLYMQLASADWRYIEKLELGKLISSNTRKGRREEQGE